MKKTTLFICGLTFTLALPAQQQQNIHAVTKAERPKPTAATLDADHSSVNFATQGATLRTPNPSTVAPSTTTRVPCGNSANILTLLVSESTPLNFNPETQLIAFTHRKCTELYTAGNVGYVQTTFSTNGGASFDSTTVLVHSSDSLHGRYPSAAIYNPPGNTNPAMAFSYVSGPFHFGQNPWIGGFFASTRFDGTLNHEDAGDTLQFGQQMPRYGSWATDSSVFSLGGLSNINMTTLPLAISQFVINQGKFNFTTNHFDWTRHIFHHAFSHDPNDNSQNVYNYGNIAFSPDGMTGYCVILGRDSITDRRSPQPIIYKSTDGGNSWSLQPIDDFGTISNLTSRLLPMTNGNPRPWFSGNNGFDLTVDVNNHLHIGCLVYGASSDDDDSLDFIYPNVRQFFDVYQTASGWDAMFVDSLLTDLMPAASSPYTTDNGIGWNARFQMSRTSDGNQIFYAWMDTNPMNSASGFNEYPDLLIKGYDVSNNSVTATKNITANTSYDASNYWMYLSPICEAGATIYNLPMTVSQTRQAGDDGSGPTQHWYVQGAQFSVMEFVGVEEHSGNISLSSIYPNPATDQAVIDIDLLHAENVRLQVYSVTGQLVLEQTEQHAPSGRSTLHFDVRSLNSGLYFVKVNAGENSVTGKMLVK